MAINPQWRNLLLIKCKNFPVSSKSILINLGRDLVVFLPEISIFNLYTYKYWISSQHCHFSVGRDIASILICLTLSIVRPQFERHSVTRLRQISLEEDWIFAGHSSFVVKVGHSYCEWTIRRVLVIRCNQCYNFLLKFRLMTLPLCICHTGFAMYTPSKITDFW